MDLLLWCQVWIQKATCFFSPIQDLYIGPIHSYLLANNAVAAKDMGLTKAVWSAYGR